MTEETTSENKFEKKVILLGSANVGKTSLFNSINKIAKTLEASPPRLNYCKRVIDYKGEKVEMLLYDTENGMSSWKDQQLTRSYYRYSIVALLVYSTDDIGSVTKLPDFIQKVQNDAPKAKLFLVRNKCDLQDSTVSEDEAVNKLKQTGYDNCISKTFITSATEGTGIDKLLKGIAKVLLEVEMPERKMSVIVSKEHQQSSHGCC